MNDWRLMPEADGCCTVWSRFIFPLLKLPFGRYKQFSDRPITYGLNAKFSRQVSQGLGFKLEIPWKRKMCVFNIPCTCIHNYTQLYTTHMQSKTWKPGNTVDKYQETIPETRIKHSVWYIVHIFCIHEALIQLIPSYPVLSQLPAYSKALCGQGAKRCETTLHVTRGNLRVSPLSMGC